MFGLARRVQIGRPSANVPEAKFKPFTFAGIQNTNHSTPDTHMIRRKHTLVALAAAGLLTATFALGHLTTSHAQDTPARPTTREQAPPPPPEDGPGPKHGPKNGPGPRGERPPPPPRPDDVRGPVKPVEPGAAPVAVKTAADTLAALTVGQVWTHTLPRGEQQLQASLVFQGKEVARLEFDPANGELLARGQHTPPPPLPGGPAAARDDRGPGADSNPPAPATTADAPKPDAAKPTDATVPAPDTTAPKPDDSASSTASATSKPVVPAKLDQVKSQLADLLKSMSTGQGAEVMPREGYWKVALINGSRIVGELRLSGDGKTVIQDFGATRDAAMFAR